MKRILLVLSLMAVMAMLFATMAVPAFAANTGEQPPGPPLLSGAEGHAVVVHCQGGSRGAAAINKNGAHGTVCR